MEDTRGQHPPKARYWPLPSSARCTRSFTLLGLPDEQPPGASQRQPRSLQAPDTRESLLVHSLPREVLRGETRTAGKTCRQGPRWTPPAPGQTAGEDSCLTPQQGRMPAGCPNPSTEACFLQGAFEPHEGQFPCNDTDSLTAADTASMNTTTSMVQGMTAHTIVKLHFLPPSLITKSRGIILANKL